MMRSNADEPQVHSGGDRVRALLQLTSSAMFQVGTIRLNERAPVSKSICESTPSNEMLAPGVPDCCKPMRVSPTEATFTRLGLSTAVYCEANPRLLFSSLDAGS